jgi:transposase
VRQRTQLINAVRGHLTEYGCAPKGPSYVAMLGDLIEKDDMANSLPEAAHAMFRLMLDLLACLNGKIAVLDKEIARRAREDEVSRRLMTVPGIGPISATAIAALAPPVETFAKGRDFAAWLGLTPLQRSTGGKQKLGATVGETGRKNHMDSSCLKHELMIWFRSANSHTGPQLHRCTIRGRTDGSIRLRADLL